MKRTIIVLFIAAICVAVGIYLYVFREADPDVGKKTADFELSAKELVEDFEMNEDSANLQFLDKILVAEGNVYNITEKDEVVTVYLKEDEDLAGVLCNFNPGSINLQSAQIGNKIKVKGICSGYLLDVVLNKCSIVVE